MRKIFKYPLNKYGLETELDLSIDHKILSAVYHPVDETIVVYIETELDKSVSGCRVEVTLLATGDQPPGIPSEFLGTVHIPVANEFWHVYTRKFYAPR